MALSLIFSSFFKSVAQIGDKRFLRVLMIGVALTIALLVAAYAALLWLVGHFIGPEAYLPILGEVRWIDDLLSGASLIFMIVLSIFLMVPVASAITSMFLEDVAAAVEARHYPQLAPATPITFWDGLRDTVNFLGVLIGANVLALVLYVVLSPLALFIFWGLNGYLLGREYFTLAATRRLGRAGAKEMRARHSGKIWLAGVLMAAPLSIPLVNLFIPILGAATFTHIFNRLWAASPSG